MVFLLSVVGYSGPSGAPLKPSMGAVALDASSASQPKPEQTAAVQATEPARDGDNAATDLSVYVFLHKTRYENIRGPVEAHANACAE